MRILVVEDDKGLANGIAFSMEREGYEVCSAGTLKRAKELFEVSRPDAVLLDLSLPDGDGIDFCKSIREQSQVPIIMLTARDMETDEVQGLLSGADDYLTKPFSLAVLKARLDTVMRRSAGRTEVHRPGEEAPDFLEAGDIRILPEKMKVFKGAQEIECSATEYRLLYYLMKNCGQVLLKEQILQQVWDVAGSFVDENTLQVTVRRLRRKLEQDPSNPQLIKTVHGMGYVFSPWRQK